VSAVLRRERGATALLLFAVLGIAVSAYLTVVHYAAVAPVCTTGGVVDCAAVTQSRWSLVPGTSIPVTVPGLLWFVAAGGMALLTLARTRAGLEEPLRLSAAQAAWAGAGLLAVFYFVYVEAVEVHRICEWCTVVHLLVLASFLVAATRLQAALPERLAEPVGEPVSEADDVLEVGRLR
jgi:uncharacterized membrane protein